MEDKEIELKEEEVAFIEGLKNKLNATEYSKLSNIIERYIQLARNKSWEVERSEERYSSAKERANKNYNIYIDEEKEKNKWKNYYTEVCNKYAKMEIELDIAKARIQILKGEKK